MKKEYDVIVIGAGGAGLNVARLLGKYDLKVCLVDSKKDLLNLSFHTLGSFIDLKKFELSEKIVASKISEIVVSSKNFHIKKPCDVYILDKQKLHAELLEKCKRPNIEILTATSISSFKKNKDDTLQSVIDQKGNQYKAKLFIDASGIVGVLSKALGLQEKYVSVATGVEYNVEYKAPSYQAHLLFGKLYEGGYGWIFPLQNKRAIVGFGSYNAAVRSELKKRLDRMCEVPFVKNMIVKDNPRVYGGTIPLTDVKTKFVYKNVVCIGDSVSQVNPLVGEGYRFVLEAGYIAAPYIYKAIKNNDIELLHGYETEWSELFYTKYRKGLRLQKFADKVSHSDIISDLMNLFVATKRKPAFTDFLSGEFNKSIFLP